jgi:hypothetical protein
MKIKQSTKKEIAYLAILKHPQGITENQILRLCSLSSGRNYPTDLERIHGVVLLRTKHPNPDGIGDHLSYSIANADSALKVINIINEQRIKRDQQKFTEIEQTRLLTLYLSKEKVTEA